MTALLLNGKTLVQGTEIGRGGEGAVFEIPGEPDRVVKIYTDGKGQERADKVRAMVGLGLHEQSPFAAFPQEIVTKPSGEFAGFVMRRITGHRPVHQLYRPADRKQFFPTADYRFLVRTAANLAAAVGSVHAAGCVIGDINESGILVKSDATVSLVDADSFQVQAEGSTYRCRVVKDEYRPPELATQRVESMVLNPNHDAFGLAVLIFHLLFMGRHPFSGTPDAGDIPMAQAIQEYRFAYSLNRDVGLKPPQHALSLRDMPDDVRHAFELAFASEKTKPRPTPKEWFEKLERLQNQLKPCPRRQRHYYPPHLSGCAICRVEGSASLFFLDVPRASSKPSRPKARPRPSVTRGAGITRRGLLKIAMAFGGAVAGAGAWYSAVTPKEFLWRLINDHSVSTFSGHSGPVFSVAFAADGRTALSGSYDKTLKLWDVASGREIRSFTGHDELVWSVAFAPGGRTALSGSDDKTLKLWDVATGRKLRRFKGHRGTVNSVAFAPDGQTALSGSHDASLKLWDVATGREIRSFTGHSGPVFSVAFAPDGRTALSGSSDKTLKLWDVASGREIRSFTGHDDLVWSVAFAPGGRTALSGSYDKTVKLWDVTTGGEIRSFKGHSEPVRSVGFAPEGRTALSTGFDKTLKLWDVATGRELLSFTGHTDFVFAVAFAPDGRTALSGSYDTTLKLWDVPEWTQA
jgi:hypothetical protein